MEATGLSSTTKDNFIAMAGRSNFVGNLYKGDQHYFCTESDQPPGSVLVYTGITYDIARQIDPNTVLIAAGVRFFPEQTTNG